jgi:gliding motility-associated-like protein
MSNFNTFQVSVAGASDGTITINSSSGPDNKFGGASNNAKEYTYSWTKTIGPAAAGLVAGQMNQINLTAGTYELTITDSNLCDKTKTFVLIEPVELLIDLGTDPTNILCFGDSTGVLIGNITQAAVSPYTYTLRGTDYTGAAVEEIISSTNALSHTFSVKAGIYNITVVDLNGATKVSANRTFTNPANPLTLTQTISSHNGFNITCNGASDGSIDATASGGTLNGGQYVYSWTAVDENGAAFLLADPTNKNQTGLGPGTYTVSVTDANACTVEGIYPITEPQPILFQNVSKNDVTCFGDNDGAIQVGVTQGTGVYNFNWTTANGSGLIGNETTTLTGLGPGDYILVLTDGCETLRFNYVIAEPAVLAITVDQKTDILCFGDTTGQLLVTVSGGNSPYGYEWEDDSGNTYNRDVGNVFNKGDLSNIPAGTYKLKVTDRLGCIANLNNVVVAEPAEIVIGIAKNDLNCASLDNGSITVTPTGGVAPYTYTWSDLGNGPNRTDLAAGTYTVKVTDNNLCEKSINVVIAGAPLFRIDPVVTPITCFGADDGTISLNLQGGTGNVNVLWTDDATAGVNRTGLKPGSYNVVLTDDAGCSIDQIIQITEPRELSLSAIITDALDCVDPLTGGIDLQIIGGTAPYTILWSTGQTTEDLTSIGANNYSVTVTDDRGCEVVQSFVIKRPPALVVTLDTSSRIVCATKEVFQVNEVNISGGTFPYTVTWSDGTVLGNGESMETKKAGSYQVTVTDKLLCSVSILFNVVLPKLGDPEFDLTSFYFQTFNAYTYNDPITFTNQSTENFLSVEWDFGDGTTSTLNNPIHTYAKSGSYDVTLYVTYIGGCLYSLTKTIYVGDSFELEIPNAFTPNGDGINDEFSPVYFGFTEITLKVFDTWGTLIFIEEATTSRLKGWNGNINGKPGENGNYIFQVSGKAFNDDLVTKNGPFTLLR